jgi:cytochrome P450
MRQPDQASGAKPAAARPTGVPTLDVRRFHANPARELAALARYLRPVMRVRTGNSYFVHVCHPDTARHVLQTNTANYLKDFSPFAPLVGDSLLAANGEKWRALRSRMQPAFAPSRFRGVGPQVIAAADRMIDDWMPFVGTQKRVDIMPGFVASTLEFIVTALFTLPADTIEQKDFEAIETGLKHGGRSLHFGAGMGTDARREFDRAVLQLDELAARIVAVRRAEGEKPDDLLTLLIDALDDPDFPEMTDKQIRDDVLTFLLAGHETTSTALGWTVRLLSRHPEAQERMRAEVSAIGGADPDYGDLKQLAFTSAVFSEAMRLRPPVPLMIRMAAEDDRIEDIRIPRGMRVGVSILGIHHHPEFWPEPAKFNPERFLGGVERAPGSYLPFSAGPRSCIGSRVAMIEGPLMLARLIQRLRIVPAPNPPLVSQSVVTLRPRDGQFVRFEHWN